MSRIAFVLALSAGVATASLAAAAPIGGAGADGQAAGRPATETLSGAYLAAKSAQLGGDLGTATGYYAEALRIDPTANVLQKDAMFAFLADGQFERGVALAAKLRDDDEAGKVARIALGIDALATGRYDAAIANFDILDPSDLDALLLGHLSAWGDIGAARANDAVERVGELDKTSWYPVFNDYQTGLLASVAGRTDAARRAFNKVIAEKDNAQTSPDAFLGAADALARLEMAAGRKADALQAVDKGLDLASSYDPLVDLKKRIETNEPVEPVIADLKRGAAETLYVLGQAINRGEGQQVAVLYFQLARALDPENPRVLVALAGIAERGERYADAIAYYRAVPAASALRRTADLQVGLDLWADEKKDEAKAHLERAVATYPNDLQAYLALADIMSAAKDYPAMSRALDTAVTIAERESAENWNLYYQRGIAYERTKQWPKAEADFRKALELSPEQPQVLNYLGYSWVDMNQNLEDGLKMIRTAVELRPNDGYIIDSLGWAYYRLGRFGDAVNELERAVLLTPADPTINDHLGDAYWQVGRTREARFQWSRALAGDPKPEPAEAEKINAKLATGLPGGEGAPRPNEAPAATEKRAESSAPIVEPSASSVR